jgi:hypothetical protein
MLNPSGSKTLPLVGKMGNWYSGIEFTFIFFVDIDFFFDVDIKLKPTSDTSVALIL